MREELVRRNYAANTIRAYLRIVRDFQQHTGKRLDRLGPDDLRQYHAYLSFAKNRSDRKPCSIRALANVKGRVKIAADNYVTQRYMPVHPASLVLENRSL
jgi:hypothetical protein